MASDDQEFDFTMVSRLNLLESVNKCGDVFVWLNIARIHDEGALESEAFFGDSQEFIGWFGRKTVANSVRNYRDLLLRYIQ